MEYRNIGQTGMKASIVGLGAEHLDGKEYAQVEATVHTALDNGINIMDAFMPGEDIRKKLGKAIAGRRDQILIQGHIGSVDLNQQYDISRNPKICKQYFEDLLRHMNTDYIDIGMLFFIDTHEAFDQVFGGEILQYARRLKEQGTIRAIGASAHNPETALRVVESGEVDLLMFSINPAFDMMPPKDNLDEMMEHFTTDTPTVMNPARTALYQACQERGVAITVMKTLAAGKLLTADQTPFRAPMTVAQCIHYALSRPGVVSALVGSSTPEQVMESLKYLSLSDAERDYAEAISGYEASFAGNCVYCNHCLPCPVNIDIAATHRLLDCARLAGDTIPDSIREQYDALPAKGSDCIACGSCESKCPFRVPIIGNMADAAQMLG